jgi:predicted nucleotidyltransferase
MIDRQQELPYLLDIVRRELPHLKKKYSIETLDVFGSYVRAEEQSTSDLDLLVTFSELPGMFKYIELENHLSDLLGIQVDLVMKDTLKPAIGEKILAEAVRI